MGPPFATVICTVTIRFGFPAPSCSATKFVYFELVEEAVPIGLDVCSSTDTGVQRVEVGDGTQVAYCERSGAGPDS